MVRQTLYSLLFISLSACSQLSSNIQMNLQSSIEANAESVTHSDWETSNFHPHLLFKNLRSDITKEDDTQIEKIKIELCFAIKNLSDDTLLIFENEILNSENSELLENCQVSLVSRLNNISKTNLIDMRYSTNALSNAPSNIDFKLEAKIMDSSDYINFHKYNGSVGDKEVILTFDDGPDDHFTASVLKTLKEAGNLKAMFFELGRQIKKYPQQTKNLHDQGHIIANHSWNHLCLNDTETCKKNNKGLLLSDEQVKSEITTTFDLIKKTVGTIAPFFRFPYGSNRESTSEYLKKSGVLEMHWNIDSNDWRYSQKVGSELVPFTSKEVLASALKTIDKHNKGVVLFHDIHRRTAEILPQFLYELYKRNYKIVILDLKETGEPNL